jgi:hypothetical protein
MSVAVQDAVYALIEATWTDVAHVMSDADADRLNWLQLVRAWLAGEESDLRTPFAVCLWGRQTVTPNGGVLNRVWEWPLTVVLVVGIGASRATESYLTTRAEALRDALYQYSGAAFQVTSLPSVDFNPSSPANQVMVKTNLPFQCVEVETVLMLGTSA